MSREDDLGVKEILQDSPGDTTERGVASWKWIDCTVPRPRATGPNWLILIVADRVYSIEEAMAQSQKLDLARERCASRWSIVLRSVATGPTRRIATWSTVVQEA